MADKFNDIQNYSTNVRINYIKRLVIYTISYLFWIANDNWVKKFIQTKFFAPRKYPTSESENQLLRQAESFRIKVNDQFIQCWRWGTGPVLIFAHGWNGRGVQFAPLIRESLKKGYSVVTFDGPGHGDSDGKSSSYFEMTDALRAVMRHYGKDEIIALIGHSFGASAIINALHKERFKIPAVLLAPALGIKEMLEGIFSLHGMPMVIYQGMVKTYEDKFGYDLEKDNPKNLLGEFPLKALIIHDRYDKVTPFAESKLAAARLESIGLLPTNGLGHKKIISDTQVVGKVLDYIVLNGERKVKYVSTAV